MEAIFLQFLLPAALAFVMFGLGLGLTAADFQRVVKFPRVVVLALITKVILLPAVAFALCSLFSLSGPFSIGLVLLAASPTSVTANIFTRIMRADVALALTLTAVDNAVTAVSLPLWMTLALSQFGGANGVVALPILELVKIFAIILVPVALGMAIRAWQEAFARRIDRGVGLISIAILALVVVAAFIKGWPILVEHGGQLIVVCVTFNVISLFCGYFFARLFRISPEQAIPSAMSMGMLGTVLSITIAMTSLNDFRIGLPAGVYGLSMYACSGLIAVAISLRRK